MKCPKCHYLGFESGDRCRNCGYDFSFLPDGKDDAQADPDPELHDGDEGPPLVDLPLNLAPLDAESPDDVRFDDHGVAFGGGRVDAGPGRFEEADSEPQPVRPERATPRKRSTPIDGLPAIRAASASSR